ncbi:MAG TPA: o-succinylbenzoate--CoA ligase [Thermomicrobiaceae bacterium]|nr:o-succinylbenzoate--CoA ligase [Thermomicrobiaceae bacterium]
MTTHDAWGLAAATGSMPDWLRFRAASTPERPAVIASDARWTFAELDARASLTARRLASLGVGPGDRVATLLHNGTHVTEVVHGIGRLGAVLVPLNVRLSAAELAWQIEDVRPALLLVDGQTAPLAAAAEQSLPALPRVGVAGASPDVIPLAALPEADVPLRERIDPDELHSIIYTSGTTGRPKGAMLTWGNFWWSAIGSALNLGTRPDDRWLACLPLFHVGGLSILTRGVIYGIAAVVHEGFDPAAVNRAIDEDGVTIVSVVSTMLRRMLAERGARPYPPTFRCALLGGGPAPRPLLEVATAHGVPVVQTYGLTETTSQLATLAPDDALRKLGSAGKPLFPNEIRVARGRVDAGPGEAGEIIVRGPVVTAGYADRPAETATALGDGWLRTGDVGYLDADGYLYVLDRRDDLIVSGGENVYPAEVEAALLAHPDVEEAGVIGVLDPEWGQAVVAVVRPGGGAALDAAVLQAFCRERLAGYKVPRHVQFTAEPLPRNAGGKLVRRALRDRWKADLPGDGTGGGARFA